MYNHAYGNRRDDLEILIATLLSRDRMPQEILAIMQEGPKFRVRCRKRSAYLDCGRVRESVSARKDAGARKGVGVKIASVGKRRVFWAILKM